MATFFEKVQKRVRILKVNETLITSRNTFIDNRFAFESKKTHKLTEELFLETGRRFLTFLLSLRPKMQHICGFQVFSARSKD